MSSDNSQPNTRINEVREENSKYLEELKLNIRCVEDDSHTAVLYCLKCEVDLCEICSDGIHSRKSLSNHKIVRLTQKPDPVIYCPLHPRSTAELVCKEPNCKNLNNPMCTICYKYETHKEHKHERLDQEYAKIRINIENCLKEIEKKRTICQKYINDHDRCISTYCDAETGFLGLEKNKIKKLANEFETSALKLLNEFVNDQVKIGEDSKNNYKSEITKLDNMRSELQNMEEMKKLEVIRNCKNVERLMRQCGKRINEPTDLIPSNCYSIIYPNIESMNVNIQSISRGPPIMKIQREIASKTIAVWFCNDRIFDWGQDVMQSGIPSQKEDVDNGVFYKYNEGRSILHLKKKPNNNTINLSSYKYIYMTFSFSKDEERLRQDLERQMEVSWWTKIVIAIFEQNWDSNKAFVQSIREITKHDERVVIIKYEGCRALFDKLCVEQL